MALFIIFQLPATFCFQFPLGAISCFYPSLEGISQVVDSPSRARQLLLPPDAIFWVKSHGQSGD
jgi:hypothetical protein